VTSSAAAVSAPADDHSLVELFAPELSANDEDETDDDEPDDDDCHQAAAAVADTADEEELDDEDEAVDDRGRAFGRTTYTRAP
jgi:hypothetical protein